MSFHKSSAKSITPFRQSVFRLIGKSGASVHMNHFIHHDHSLVPVIKGDTTALRPATLPDGSATAPDESTSHTSVALTVWDHASGAETSRTFIIEFGDEEQLRLFSKTHKMLRVDVHRSMTVYLHKKIGEFYKRQGKDPTVSAISLVYCSYSLLFCSKRR